MSETSENRPAVDIVMDSKSDWPVMQANEDE